MDDDAATEILAATYRALCDRGYADVTLGDIAAEAETSKGLIHYYYDDKETLFAAFLDFLYDRYTEQVGSVAGETPRGRLVALFETVLADGEGTAGEQLRTAMLAANAQAPCDDAIRTRLARFDEYLLDRVESIVADGVEVGEFDDEVDPAVAAEFLVTAIYGAHTRRATADRSSDRLAETMTHFAERHLVADGPTEVPS
ncbi:TetR family transcriptional regulator [Halosimplex carlsbadense 2-9-1]|uniref:TetR family transcriptional regulator n=1 Tax=Halosimplex carlsbadense 2-9-1 TaxID=797114 RepID=M0CWG4_9EURY|nr:TetR/AcrR family transcriptional regulator [Halosimplex carlsbadense]ELZ27561.1 TetR family transcriptional regulator [Halosimplex carlsbadense 2-9-1]